MKFKWTVVALVAALALGTLCYIQYQWSRATNQKATVEQLQRSLDQKTDQLQELQASKEHLNEQRRQLLTQAEAQALELRKQSAATAANAREPKGGSVHLPNDKPVSAEEGFGKLLAKMMEDPQTKNFIREQQRMVMDQLYAPLAKQLGLTADQAAKFKDLMADTAVSAAEKASSLFDGGTNRTEALAAMAAETKKQEEQMKELLGENGFAQYKEYQTTVGERMQLNMFRQQLSGGDAALNDQQTEQLLSMIKEEKQIAQMGGQPIITSGQDPAEVKAILSDDQSEQLIQSQEAVNERVYERAKTVLSPEQLNSFAKFQTNHLQMMRMGMGMARKLMGGDRPAQP